MDPLHFAYYSIPYMAWVAGQFYNTLQIWNLLLDLDLAQGDHTERLNWNLIRYIWKRSFVPVGEGLTKLCYEKVKFLYTKRINMT